MKDVGRATYRIVFDCVVFSVLKSTLIVSFIFAFLVVLVSPSGGAFFLFVGIFSALFAPIIVLPAIILGSFLIKSYLKNNILNMFRWMFASLVIGTMYVVFFSILDQMFFRIMVPHFVPISLLTGYFCWKKFVDEPKRALPE